MNDRLQGIKHRETKATKGPWEHGAPPNMSFEEMRSEYAKSLKATLDHFGGDYLNRVHGVYEKESEVRVCITGISPHSPDNADFIANARDDIPYLLSRLEAAEVALRSAMYKAGSSKSAYFEKWGGK